MNDRRKLRNEILSHF